MAYAWVDSGMKAQAYTLTFDLLVHFVEKETVLTPEEQNYYFAIHYSYLTTTEMEYLQLKAELDNLLVERKERIYKVLRSAAKALPYTL